MPVNIDIVDFKCFNQLRNGIEFDTNTSEFTKNVVGNIGEIVKIQYDAILTHDSSADDTDEWFIDLENNEITRSSGSFLDDSLQVGYRYFFFNNWNNRKSSSEDDEYQADINFISSDGLVLGFTVVTGTPSTSGTASNVGIAIEQLDPINRSDAVFLRFGIIGNDETFNYQSKISESPQVYYLGGIGATSESADSLGVVKDWVSGNAKISRGAVSSGFLGLRYRIEQDFILSPFYTLSFREFIDNGTIPELLEGDTSMKYVAELDFRKTLTDTGSSKVQSFDGLDGFIGWYGENFNGLNSNYNVKSIAYEELSTSVQAEAININTTTKATIIIENVNEDITSYSCGVYLIKLPSSEDDYVGTKTSVTENFLYKSEIISSPDTTSDNVTTSIVDGDLVIEYDIEYSVSERLRLTTEDEYMIMIQVEDSSVSAGDSDRVMMIADLKNYTDINYVEDFVNVYDYSFLQHGQLLGVNNGQSNPIVSNEDGILLKADIGVNTARNVVINSANVKLIAYNSVENKSFDLDSYSFNLGGPVFSSGIQEINVESERGYILSDDDDFNLVEFKTADTQGDDQLYEVRLGQKIKWQEWILNSAVDGVFYDSNEPNNNINFKSSNYSGSEGYVIKAALILNVTGVDDLDRQLTGDYIHYGGNITVNDYGESSSSVTGVIQTFDLDTGNSLEGAILYNGKDTLFKTVFSNADSMQYGIHRIEPSQNQGDGIYELSSLFDTYEGNLLKPIDGETKLKFDLSGSSLETSCLIDGSLIQEGVAYKLSARTGIYTEPYDFGLAIRGDGVNDRIITDQLDGIPLDPDNWSVSCWVNFNSTPLPAYSPYIFQLGEGSAIFRSTQLRYTESGGVVTLNLSSSGAVTGGVILSVNVPFDSDWHHIVITRKTDPLQPTVNIWSLYYDAVAMSVDQPNDKVRTPTIYSDQETIIADRNLIRCASISVDQFEIFHSYLTSSDVSSVNLDPSFSDTLNPLVQLKFNKTGAIGGGDNTSLDNVCLDTSVNGYNWNLENFAKIGVTSNWIEH